MQLTNLASFQLILWNILKKYNIDSDDVFRKVKLNPAMMQKPGKRYPIRKTDALWQEAAKRISDPCFGLKVEDCWHPSHLGTLGFAVLTGTNLRATLELMIRFHKVVSDIQFAELWEDHDAGTLVFSLTDREGDPPAPCLEDAALALVILVPLGLNRYTAPNPADRTFSREEIQIVLEEGVLTISGVRQDRCRDHKIRLHQMEIDFGSFHRRIRLGVPVQEERITSIYSDGFLEVRIPKRFPDATRAIPIEDTE